MSFYLNRFYFFQFANRQEITIVLDCSFFNIIIIKRSLRIALLHTKYSRALVTKFFMSFYPNRFYFFQFTNRQEACSGFFFFQYNNNKRSLRITPLHAQYTRALVINVFMSFYPNRFYFFPIR